MVAARLKGTHHSQATQVLQPILDLELAGPFRGPVGRGEVSTISGELANNRIRQLDVISSK